MSRSPVLVGVGGSYGGLKAGGRERARPRRILLGFIALMCGARRWERGGQGKAGAFRGGATAAEALHAQ